MSPELVGAFEQQWPDVAKRLQGMLAGKNVPASKRDDVVQETGLRLFGMWEKVDRNRPVWPLVVTIALNLLRDEARRNQDREILGAVPEMPTLHDVEHQGLARIELERVQMAMAQLSPSHRDVLLNEIEPNVEVPTEARNATKMMRLRARRALTTLLETAVLRAGMVTLRIRRSLGMNEPFLPIQIGGGEAAAAPAAALALAALLFGTINVQAPNVANASEVPKGNAPALAELSPQDAAAIAASGAPDDDLALAVKEMRPRAFGHKGVTKDNRAKREADRTGTNNKRTAPDPGSKKDPHDWGAPPPTESSPIEVPLPVGEGYAGGEAGVGAVGANVGNRPGSETPACVSGIEPGSLGCGTEAPKEVRVQAGAAVEVNGEKHKVEVDEEVSTEDPQVP